MNILDYYYQNQTKQLRQSLIKPGGLLDGQKKNEHNYKVFDAGIEIEFNPEIESDLKEFSEKLKFRTYRILTIIILG